MSDNNYKYYGKAVYKLAMSLPEEQRDAYMLKRDKAYGKIKKACVESDQVPPPPIVLSGGSGCMICGGRGLLDMDDGWGPVSCCSCRKVV